MSSKESLEYLTRPKKTRLFYNSNRRFFTANDIKYGITSQRNCAFLLQLDLFERWNFRAIEKQEKGKALKKKLSSLVTQCPDISNMGDVIRKFLGVYVRKCWQGESAQDRIAEKVAFERCVEDREHYISFCTLKHPTKENRREKREASEVGANLDFATVLSESNCPSRLCEASKATFGSCFIDTKDKCLLTHLVVSLLFDMHKTVRSKQEPSRPASPNDVVHRAVPTAQTATTAIPSEGKFSDPKAAVESPIYELPEAAGHADTTRAGWSAVSRSAALSRPVTLDDFGGSHGVPFGSAPTQRPVPGTYSTLALCPQAGGARHGTFLDQLDKPLESMLLDDSAPMHDFARQNQRELAELAEKDPLTVSLWAASLPNTTWTNDGSVRQYLTYSVSTSRSASDSIANACQFVLRSPEFSDRIHSAMNAKIPEHRRLTCDLATSTVDVDDKCSTWCFRIVTVGSTPATYSDHASMVHSWDVSRAVDFVISVMLQLHRVLQVQEAPCQCVHGQ
eukprot:m.398831 g.398831  ORF g.398831 m.398831 type:complete len:508 (+) comp21141_c0_seq16:325-1848(+)